MSLERDQEFDRQFAIQAAQEARDFVVGATVYRHNHNRDGKIEEGFIRRVTRSDASGNYEHPKGEYPLYVAEFPRPGLQGDWESQTYAWKFWATREGAVADLLEYIDRWLEDEKRNYEREVRRLEATRARLAAP